MGDYRLMGDLGSEQVVLRSRVESQVCTAETTVRYQNAATCPSARFVDAARQRGIAARKPSLGRVSPTGANIQQMLHRIRGQLRADRVGPRVCEW